jgi:hypothetical protein
MSNEEHWRKLREATTVREWSKELLTDYVQHFVGERGWEKFGATSPEHVVDIIFAQIQVSLLGYANGVQEIKSKEEAIDRLLVIKK